MKTIIAALCTALVLGSSGLQAQSKTDDIRKLLRLTGVASQRTMDQMFDMVGANFSKDPKAQEFWKEYRKEIKLEELFDSMVPIYDKYLSHDDVKGVIAFYESPVGKRFMEVMPQMMGEIMNASMAWSRSLVEKVMQKMKEKGVQ